MYDVYVHIFTIYFSLFIFICKYLVWLQVDGKIVDFSGAVFFSIMIKVCASGSYCLNCMNNNEKLNPIMFCLKIDEKSSR